MIVPLTGLEPCRGRSPLQILRARVFLVVSLFSGKLGNDSACMIPGFKSFSSYVSRCFHKLVFKITESGLLVYASVHIHQRHIGMVLE